MKKITDLIEQKIGPLAMKFSNLKYIQVVKNAFYSTVAFVIIGSLAALIVRAPVDSTTLNPGFIKTLMQGWELLKQILFIPFKAVNQYTVGIYSIYIAAACGYHVGKIDGLNPILSAIIGVSSFLVTTSLTVDGSISTAYLGSAGLLPAMIFSILAVELVSFLFNKNFGKIDLAKYGAPPTLSDSFAIIIPVATVLIALSLFGYVLLVNVGPIPELLSMLISPLVTVVDNVWFMTFFAALFGLFWWFGIHDGVLNSIINPVTSMMLVTNIEMYSAGTAINDLPYIGTKGFFWTFLLTYGILPLTILCLFSKSEQIKTMGKVGVVPALFGVTEPMTFGLPICYNSYLLLPYMLVPAVNILVSYTAIKIGLMNKVCAFFTTTIPAPIHAFLVTTDYRSVIVVLILYVIDAIIWYPFLKMYENECLKNEANAAKNEGVQS